MTASFSGSAELGQVCSYPAFLLGEDRVLVVTGTEENVNKIMLTAIQPLLASINDSNTELTELLSRLLNKSKYSHTV